MPSKESLWSPLGKIFFFHKKNLEVAQNIAKIALDKLGNFFLTKKNPFGSPLEFFNPKMLPKSIRECLEKNFLVEKKKSKGGQKIFFFFSKMLQKWISENLGRRKKTSVPFPHLPPCVCFNYRVRFFADFGLKTSASKKLFFYRTCSRSER